MADEKNMPKNGTCFTINNYTEDNIVAANNFVGKCGVSYICYAKEVGESGTPHLQGYLQSNCREFPRFQKIMTGAYMPQKGTSDQAIQYCSGPYEKDGKTKPINETFVEFGTKVFIKGPKQGERTDLDVIKDAFDAGETYKQLRGKHFGTFAKYSRFFKEYANDAEQDREKKIDLDLFKDAILKPWQQCLLDILKEQPHPRRVYWFWEKEGSKGKSWMAEYLAANYDALILDLAKKADMAHIFAENPKKIVIFDLVRSTEPKENGMNPLVGLYSLAEGLKNGRIISPKYESKSKRFRSPHVVFFANFPPEMERLSQDRWYIQEI